MPAASQGAFATADIPALLDTLETTTSMIEAFGAMMEFAVRSGEDLKSLSFGMERLLNQQCEDLRAVEEVLRDRFIKMKESKLEIMDLDQVAQWAGVSRKKAALVISIATGVNLAEGLPYTGEGEHPYV